jgi:hypothetical protein
MDNRYRGNLEREIDAHRSRIDELVEELSHVESIAERIARVPWQLIRHAALLRVALKGRRAAVEIFAGRLATNCAR